MGVIWIVKSADPEVGFRISKKSGPDGREIVYGRNEAAHLFDVLSWLADLLEPGSLVQTPEGWSAYYLPWIVKMARA